MKFLIEFYTYASDLRFRLDSKVILGRGNIEMLLLKLYQCLYGLMRSCQGVTKSVRCVLGQ